jgi:hypothetical protein
MGKKDLSPYREGEGQGSLVKTHTTTSPQYTLTLLLQGCIAVTPLRSSTDRPNGKKDQSPWLKGK